MSDLKIRVDSLSKRYRIGALEARHTTLRDKIANAFRSPFRQRPPGGEEFWALRDVTFDVRSGEVVGLVGRNGAGKSTLLKILSRITEPTSGHAELHGRVGSLLEVGTGFHEELTGRENLFLNGAILGMQRAEIQRQFDQIVAFAEVDKFIDTPVKHYSSGMYLRLAFSIAAHLDPEILLVDEVLAVGDVKFQEKCLGKMSEVAGGGRTIIFVSHNLGAIQRLCPRSILLDHGTVVATDASAAIVQRYLGLLKDEDQLPSRGQDIALQVRVLSEKGEPTLVWRYGEKIVIEVRVRSLVALANPSIDLGFYTGSRVRLFNARSERAGTGPAVLTGAWKVSFSIDNPGLSASEMVFDVGIREGKHGYRKLVTNAGMLTADQASLPEDAEAGWMLRVQAEVAWELLGDRRG